MAKRMKTVQESAEKWQRRVQGASTDYKAGIQGATGWAEGALGAVSRTHAGLQQAIADGRIAAGIQRAGDQKWKTAALGKGVTNWTNSTSASRPAYEQGMNRAMAYQQAALAATAGMPMDTVEQRVAKAAAHQLAVAAAARADKSGR